MERKNNCKEYQLLNYVILNNNFHTLVVPDDLFLTNQNNGTPFEQFFSKQPGQVISFQEKFKSITYELNQTKKQLFQLENFTDNYTDIIKKRNKYFSSPSNTQNQYIHLSDIAKNLPSLNQANRKKKQKQAKINKPIEFKQIMDTYEDQPEEQEEIFEKTQNFIRQLKMPSVVQEKHLNKMLPLQTFHYNQDQEFSDVAIRHPELGKKITSEIQDNENPNDQLLEMIESDEEIRPNTHTSSGKRKKLTTPNIQDQIKPSSSSQYVQLLNSKQSLITHRYLKYNALYSRLLQFDLNVPQRKRRRFKSRVIVVLFCIQIISATQESILNYHKQSLTHYRTFFPVMNEECLQFVNLSLIKQIIYKPNRVQMMQKLEKKSAQQRILQIQCSAEIVKEIFEKLNQTSFSSRLYKFFKCISNQGYFQLNQFHCPFVNDNIEYSQYFGYLDFCKKKDKKYLRRIILADFIVIKNIIFYGLLFKTQELFKQFNIQFDIIYMIIFILLYSILDEEFFNVNLKDLVNLTFDGQFVIENIIEINKAKKELWEEIIKETNVNIDLNGIKKESQKWFQQILERTS